MSRKILKLSNLKMIFKFKFHFQKWNSKMKTHFKKWNLKIKFQNSISKMKNKIRF